jgi:hypothetical protein
LVTKIGQFRWSESLALAIGTFSHPNRSGLLIAPMSGFYF